MTARHRLPEHDRPAPQPKRRGLTASRANVLIGSIAASVAVAGVGSAAIVELTSSEAPTTQSAGTASQQRPLNQQGTLIAINGESVTARSANGFTQTYQLTPDTTAITDNGGQIGDAAKSFAVNDDVAIVGTVQGGTATATAVAAADAIGPEGRPMDSVDVQPVSHSIAIP